MVTILSSGVVTILLFWALFVARLISVFLFLFSMAALLAANELVPAGTSDTMVLLAVCSLWVELAQIEKVNGPRSGRKVSKQDWRLFWGSFVGLTLGGILWYEWNEAAPLVLAGAYSGAFFMALVNKHKLVECLRRALLLVERGLCGVILKLCFCGLLLLSLTK